MFGSARALARHVRSPELLRLGKSCSSTSDWGSRARLAGRVISPQHRLPSRSFGNALRETQRQLVALGYSHRQLHSTGRSACPANDIRLEQTRIDDVADTSRTQRRLARSRRGRRLLTFLALFLAATWASYEFIPPARHLLIALVRCTRLVYAVAGSVLDYKWTFAKRYDPSQYTEEEIKELRRTDRHAAHARSSRRVYLALQANRGIYIKLGQHVSAMAVLPKEWTETMRPLQDQCYPTSVEDIDKMLRKDIGLTLDEMFSEFDPRPLGVASLAQVHRAVDRRTNRKVAVKIQHPNLEEFFQIDIATVQYSMRVVKAIFPEFEFSWLGDEMAIMLPKEMDFVNEAMNADRAREDFVPLTGKTSLHIPEVLWAEKRVMCMEFIEGKRVDDLEFLKNASIDRNQVSQELSRIFATQVYLNGFFHADPHQGNILIRKKAPDSKSPFNFDICLLDWGQCFSIPDELRVNYARFWLSLIAKNSPKTLADRKRYAKLVGNVDEDMYPILESAITGRIGLAESDPNVADSIERKSSLLEMSEMNQAEMNVLRNAMVEREGLIQDIFALLRNAPRVLIIVLKLNDLTRSLDVSLATTHGPARVFLIVARACSRAVWQDDKREMHERWSRQGLTLGLVREYVSAWFAFQWYYTGLRVVETVLDAKARLVKTRLFLQGLSQRGWSGAWDRAGGIA